MSLLALLLLVAAIVVFIIASLPRNLVAIGLALLSVALLVQFATTAHPVHF